MNKTNIDYFKNHIRTCGTGHVMTEYIGEYVGTLQLNGYVFHVFEVPK